MWCKMTNTGTISDGTKSEGTISEGTKSEGTISEGTISEGTISDGHNHASAANVPPFCAFPPTLSDSVR